jgi:phosphoglycerate dehydrogenase-like enzyme
MIIEKRVTSHSRLGFIGLGHLGSRVARRFIPTNTASASLAIKRSSTREKREGFSQNR